ncbi:putative f5/8 type C domain protein [Monocercomonoides exilis]|uniref:putative f5/8 type C domain protein n=1 Tax=Monocercomonoides exilis TaxID=2049356 RepID=UPI003559B902|nr:putative f5/8 type C domain protein [Monocercomonoides exilis]|eukprot:MONOS_10974.1-p1 / transcript=MONOS_10974.1 / gene=MONOS_10974 / organism=Monocercomonoides_exilis_PA203 / gene_product=putative uncharacterized protein / transcript_product=putative uncharacterized protein / location=Mono_scaffold00523:38477-42592(+) / protein_length=829 / sequence_SO=supercontig / SO=protein_coding / is_pseudo=false
MKFSHLTTNGLISTLKPNNTISISSQWLDQPRTHSVRTLLNRNRNQTFICIHPQTWVDVTVPSSAKPASSYTIRPGTYASSRNPKSWTLLGSNDNRTWAILSDVANFMFEENDTEASHFQIDQKIRFATYRLNITKNNGNTEGMYGGMLELAEFDLLDADGKSILHRPASNRAKVRDNYWEARTTNNEWVVIDFGALSSLSTVVISWGLDSIGHEYGILASNGSTSELQNGKAVFASVYEERSGGSKGTVHTIKLKDDISCRLMKLLVRGAVAKPLSSPLDTPSRFSAIRVAQIEVIGSNDLVVKPSPRPPFDEKRMRQDLSGGSWKVKRASEVEGKGSELSLGKEFDEDIIEREQSGGTVGRNTEQAKEEADKADRMEDGWVIATVPGTVLVSYLNVGAIPDPNFGDQQLQISDWFFTTDFWYCCGFDVSEKMRGKRCWLNFDGINWKADIWVNGAHRLWPRGELWGLHDFALGSAQNGRRFLSEATLFGNDRVFNKEAASEVACAGSSSTNSNDSNTSSLICSASFAANPFEEFVWRSQFVNYENHKAMFEGSTLRESRGLLMWMSQSCWPSMVWQTYDFFFDTNAGYFGCKKGNQPFSVVYNIDSKNISVVNNAWKRWENVKIEVWVHDLHGKKLNSFEGEMTMSENTMVSPPPFAFSVPQEGIFFVSTRASQVKGKEVEVISDNFYWDKVGGSRSFMDFSGLKNATIAAGVSGVEETPAPSLLSFWSATPSSLPDSASQSSIRRFSVTLNNTSPDPALLVHLQLYRVPSSSSSSSSTSVPLTSRVLPVYFSDNWFGLMPQTSKTVSVEFDSKWLHGDSFVVVVDG